MPEQDIHVTAQMPGRTLQADGKEYLFFSGTSYLGISCNLKFRELLQQGFSLYGTNYSSSRNSNLQLQVFEEAEAYLATFTGAEAAITMSSGYLAGQALMHSLQHAASIFLYAPDTHPALWRDLSDAPDNALTYDEWVAKILLEIPALPHQDIILICNSLDPLKAQDHSFEWVKALPPNKSITLVIDDSHGLGITGTNGAGIWSYLVTLKHLAHITPVVVGSLGKAFGIPAGVILGDKEVVSQVKKSPYFGGASPAIPAYLYTFLHSGSILAEARQQLFANITYFLERLDHPEQLSYFNRYPVFYTLQHELYPYLLQQNIMISSFRYPTPADAPITRLVLNSLHTTRDLDTLAEAVNAFKV